MVEFIFDAYRECRDVERNLRQAIAGYIDLIAILVFEDPLREDGVVVGVGAFKVPIVRSAVERLAVDPASNLDAADFGARSTAERPVARG